ncbi:MAG: hypothetical protein U0R26_05730 [Solirubrobacterales bacterium]
MDASAREPVELRPIDSVESTAVDRRAAEPIDGAPIRDFEPALDRTPER